MPQFSDLSAEAQAAANELLDLVRPMAAEIYKFARRNRPLVQQWNSNPEGEASTLSALIGTLDAGALLPNQTNLDGADQVTKEALQNVMGYVSAIAGHDTTAHLNVMLPFSGTVNFQ